MKTDVRTIADITGSDFTGYPDAEINYLLIDSRKVSELSAGTMFIALKSDKDDGHRYIVDMYRSGVRIFLVEKANTGINKKDYPDASFIFTENVISALQKIAEWKRKSYSGKLIAITGSNGKTIVKEWLSDILSQHENIIRSPRSYNSQIGVPLSLWNLDNEYERAVIEAGMSRPGEITRLEKIIKPDIGIFTSIGEAHQENFNSLEEKIHEKLGLFINAQTIIYPADRTEIHDSIRSDERLKGKKLVSWSAGRNKESDIIIIQGINNRGITQLTVKHDNKQFTCEIPFSDRASVENISTIITTLIYLGIDSDSIADGVNNLQPVAMRLEQKEGINSCLLLEDYYNSDPGSLRIALEYLNGISDKNLTLILSDFVQGRRNREKLYSEVADDIRKAGINRLIAIGNDLSKYRDLFKINKAEFFTDTDDFIRKHKIDGFDNETILIKGARVFEFERIGKILELKTHQTQLEINLDNIRNNLDKFRTYLDKDTGIMAMVKAFAYGAGPKEISDWLVYNGVNYFAVAYPDEGIKLRKEGVRSRIMVMNPDRFALRALIEYELEPEIYGPEILKSFINEVKRHGIRNYPVHIKLDTGMHRLGFMEKDIEEMAGVLTKSRDIRVATVFSHLAAAYDPEMDSTTHEQAGDFIRMCTYIREETGETFLMHLLNSAGIVRFPQYQFDMVRPGIGLYGISEVEIPGLKPSTSFYTRISQVKTIAAGEGLGYGLKDADKRERKIAILPVGYADGLRRILGQGRGRVYINGDFYPVIGNICMDMCMIDISNTNLKAGEKVEIFGDNIPVKQLADLCHTIPYEILTGVPTRVKRIFLYE